ncbi:hypothetical protein ACP4OV_022899 [Aristida adscensionis]
MLVGRLSEVRIQLQDDGFLICRGRRCRDKSINNVDSAKR